MPVSDFMLLDLFRGHAPLRAHTLRMPVLPPGELDGCWCNLGHYPWHLSSSSNISMSEADWEAGLPRGPTTPRPSARPVGRGRRGASP